MLGHSLLSITNECVRSNNTMYNISASKLFNVPQKNTEKLAVRRSNATSIPEEVLYVKLLFEGIVLGMSNKSDMTLG